MARTALIHILLTLPGVLALLAAAALFILKITGYGIGPTLDWGLVVGLAVGAIIVLAVDAAIVANAGQRHVEEFTSKGFDHQFFRNGR